MAEKKPDTGKVSKYYVKKGKGFEKNGIPFAEGDVEDSFALWLKRFHPGLFDSSIGTR